MRSKKPRRSSIDEVMITRDGDTAIIEHADPAVSVTRFKIGPQIDSMSDAAILDFFNLTIERQEELAAEYDNTVIEIPLGRPQIKYIEASDQWMPRGKALRCRIEDNRDGELVVCVDDQELSLHEFGRMLATHAGWGMRITFVPEDRLTDEPVIEVREPQEHEE